MCSQCQVISYLDVMTPQMHEIHDNIHFTIYNTTQSKFFKARS